MDIGEVEYARKALRTHLSKVIKNAPEVRFVLIDLADVDLFGVYTTEEIAYIQRHLRGYKGAATAEIPYVYSYHVNALYGQHLVVPPTSIVAQLHPAT